MLSPLTDAVPDTSLSEAYPFNSTLKKLKEDCTKLLKANPILWEAHKEFYAEKGYDEASYTAALFANFELHATKITETFSIMMVHTDKNRVGAVCFYCFTGESFNYFLVFGEGEAHYATDLGDYEIHQKWKDNLKGDEKKSFQAFEEDLFAKANNKDNHAPRIVVVHFTPGKRIMFNPGCTFHGVVSLGKSHIILPQNKQETTRCMGVLYSADITGGKGFIPRCRDKRFDEDFSMEQMVRAILAEPKEWHLPPTAATVPEENQVPIVIIADGDNSSGDMKPAAKEPKKAASKESSSASQDTSESSEGAKPARRSSRRARRATTASNSASGKKKARK